MCGISFQVWAKFDFCLQNVFNISFFFLRKNFKCINVKMISEPIATPLGIGW